MDDMVRRGRVAACPPTGLAPRDVLGSWNRLLEGLPVGVYACDRDGLLIQYNSKAAELWGQSPAPGDARYRFCGAHKAFAADGAPLGRSDAPMAEMLRTGAPVRDRELIVERPDGTRIVILANVDPLLDDDGRIVGGVNCFQNITAVKQAEQKLQDSERRYRDLIDALPAAVYTTDADGRITYYNRAAEALSGRRPELGSDQWCVSWRLYQPDGTPLPHDQCPMAVALRENRPIRDAEAVAERPDGTRVPFIPYPTPLRDPSGAVVGAVNMLVDISERKQAETRQRALIDEINHRVKNTLATVQSVAAQTIRGSGVPKQVREAFEARLLALSRTHDRLAQASWESADLAAIVDDVVAPYRDHPAGCIRLEGGSVDLTPKAALTLSMVLHELAANAAEHGALSDPAGDLHLCWRVATEGAEATLELDWRERGGPPVRPPARRGFGTRLLERGIGHELAGEARLAFDAGGVHCRISLPLPRRCRA